MISRISGFLVEKMPPIIVVDVQGVGYELLVSMQTFYLLPQLNEPVVLHTQFIVREDAHTLFGFADVKERAAFRALIKVSGIGAKTALGILSSLSIQELSQAIVAEDVKRLSSAPGIGKKTAERMVLELRGKLSEVGAVDGELAPARQSTNSDDIVGTLLALGYTENEAKKACSTLPESIEVGEGVRLALKNMVK